MDLILCTKCEKEISDSYNFCPYCGHKLPNSGLHVYIKIPSGLGKSVTIKNSEDNTLLWLGEENTIAKFKIEKPTKISIKISGSLSDIRGVIEPNRKYECKKYSGRRNLYYLSRTDISFFNYKLHT